MSRLIALTAALALAGCSSSRSSDPFASAESFCNALGSELVTKEAGCFGETASQARLWIDYSVSCALVGAAVEAGHATYDAAAAKTCVQAVKDTGCHAFGGNPGPPASCLDAVKGQLAPGDPCTLDSLSDCAGGWCSFVSCGAPGTCVAYLAAGGECGGGQRCAPGTACTDGSCRPEPSYGTVAQDQGCSSSDECQEALYCQGGTCQPRLAPGAECSAGDACPDGYSCTGTCVAWKGVGADCTPGQWECLDGAYCDAGTSKCVGHGQAGATCGYPTNGAEYHGCVDGSYCKESPPPAARAGLSTWTGVCTAYLELEAPCNQDAEYEQCGPYALCLDGRCAPAYCNPR